MPYTINRASIFSFCLLLSLSYLKAKVHFNSLLFTLNFSSKTTYFSDFDFFFLSFFIFFFDSDYDFISDSISGVQTSYICYNICTRLPFFLQLLFLILTLTLFLSLYLSLSLTLDLTLSLTLVNDVRQCANIFEHSCHNVTLCNIMSILSRINKKFFIYRF